MNKKHQRPSQALRILRLFRDGKWHSAIELHKICWRTSARIFELKKKGWPIERKLLSSKNHCNIFAWRLKPNPKTHD